MISTANKSNSDQKAVVEASSSDEEEIGEQTAEDQLLEDEEFPMSEDDDGEESADDDAEEDESEEDEEAGDSKWAATMAKLVKQKGTETLSKAKKDKEIEQKKEKPIYKFEIVGKESSETVGDEGKPDDKKLAQELIRQKTIQKKERKKTILGLRQIPAIGDYEREKTLKKIATKGCVQLFNAVRAQQKDIHKKLQDAGKLESKRDKVLKNVNRKEFLNALMSGPRAESEFVDNLVKDELKDELKSEDESEDEKSTWNALKPDFLTGKKSGWDKEEDEADEADNIDASNMNTDDSE